jgi:Uri superfamily endonuclease
MIRKKRSDRNHVIYRMEMDTGDTYVGLTVAQGSAFLRSVKVRVQKHMSRARKEDKAWNLYSFLRDNENVSITYEVLEVVRGRKPAHQRERELISELNPTLNTF